ncbi:MAG TPA: monovalent cation/H(+) antiporter subunit G [Vicinamibacterales bacterium]|nr:monovalent cation/H(+) antiporter subunit G [Vicinamibacterales bacterium]
MMDWISVSLLAVGAVFTLLAAVGVMRLPDLFTRMQASTKSATLGVACMMMATLTHFGDLTVSARALLIVAALFLTAPVAAHAIGRAAYLRGVELWDGTMFDELREHREGRTSRTRGERGRGDAFDHEDEDLARAGELTGAGADRRR